MIQPQSIAVLGAGPMGLAVAYQLVQDGHHPVIFEADDRVGGMTAAFDFGGLDIERFYHFHCTSDNAFFEVLEELGISEKMNWVQTKMGYYYKNKLVSWGNPLALLRFPGLSLIAKIRYGLHAFVSTKRNNWSSLDKTEASQWIKRWVGQEAYDVLWKTLFDFKFYHYANNLSAAWIWSRIRRIGRSRYNIFKEKLGYLEGGSATLLESMKSYIQNNGGNIHLSTPIQQVVLKNGTVQGIMSNETFHPFDKVISTVPTPFVPRLLPDLPEITRKAYESINNIAVVCVIAKLKKPVTENFWLNINDPEMDIPGLVEYTNLRPLDHHIVYVPFYMPGEHAKYQDANEVFIEKVKKYIQKINPMIEESDFIELRANRYRYAQPICEPDFLKKLPPISPNVTGLWVADTSYYYPEDRGISESIQFGRNMARMATK